MMSKETQANLDPIQQTIGQLGRWHVFVCCIVFLLKFPIAWHQLSIIFLAPNVPFECAEELLQKCDINCTEWVYDKSIFSETIVSQWDLVCSRKALANWSQTIFMFGVLVGSLLFGVLSDKYGRRPPLVIAVIIQLVSGIATSFAPWFWLFCILRFICAVVTGGTTGASFVLIMEIVGPKWREVVLVLYQMPFNLAHLSLAGFGYLSRDWRYLQFTLSIPSIFFLSYYWILPESPRYLLTVGRVDEAITVLEKAAKHNKLPTENIRTTIKEIKIEPVDKGNFGDLFRTPKMRKITILTALFGFVCGMCFFGVAQYIGNIGGNIYVNVAISAALEFPGSIACIFLLKYYGRRLTMLLAYILTGVMMLSIAFISPENHIILVILAAFGLAGMCIAFAAIYVYSAELLPTVVRNVGMGTNSSTSRIGSMIAPFIATIGNEIFWLPPVILGLLPLLSAPLVYLLPETQGFRIPETIEDVENFERKTDNK